MLRNWQYAYPETRLLSEDVYGTRLIHSGVDHSAELDILQEAGVSNIGITFQALRGMLRKPDFDFEDVFRPFEIVVIDPCSKQMIADSTGETGVNSQILDFTSVIETFKRWITFAVSPYHAVSVLGIDYYLDYMDAVAERSLPILPVLALETMPLFEELFGRYDEIIVSRELLQDYSMNRKVFAKAREMNTKILALNLEDTHTISKASNPFYVVMNSAWKNGSKHGVTYLFENGRLEYYGNGHKHVRKQCKELLQSHGIDVPKVLAGVHFAVDHMNAVEWKLYGDKLAGQHHNSYWLSKIEKAKAEDQDVPGNPAETALRVVGDRSLAVIDERNPHIDPRLLVAAECDNCQMADRCPYYKPAARCAYKAFESVETVEDVTSMLGVALGMQSARVQQMAMEERLNGNVMDSRVSTELDRLFKNAKIWKDVSAPPVSKSGKSGGSTVNVNVNTSEGKVGMQGYFEGTEALPIEEGEDLSFLDVIEAEATEVADES